MAQPQLKAVAFDLDGTLYLGSAVLPGAVELVRSLTAAGKTVLFVTNNSSVARTQYLDRLTAMGLTATADQLITSNDVAIAQLRELGFSAPFLLATPAVTEEYRRNGLDVDSTRRDAVVLTFDTTLSYDKLRQAARYILQGLPYFATHPDLVCPTPEGPIPDCGSFMALLRAATGVSPKVFGKPEPPMARAIIRRCQAPPKAIAFVGDRLYTDIRMANENGMLAILTLTGESSLDDLGSSPYKPDLVVRSLNELATEFDSATGIRGRQ